jgi:hypothetical protein
MYGGLQVCTDIRIDDDCSIRCDVNGSGEAEFVVADRNESLGIVVRSEALREFLKVAGEALAEMDARYARELVEDQVHA